MSGTVSTQDQAFVTTDGQMNVTEIESGLLAQTKSANAANAEVGRWFASQHGFLQGALDIIGTQTGASVPQTPGPDNTALLQTLNGLSGTAFDQAYLPAEASGHAMNLAAHQTETASGTNALVKQVATAETPIVQNHLYELQLLTQQQLGGAAPTTSLATSFTASPPLATEGPLNTADRNFIASATYAALTAIEEGQLAQQFAAAPSVQVYGNWNITNNGPLAADVAALAQAGGASVPTTLDPTDAAQVAALSNLRGSAFNLQYAVNGIGNYQAVLQVLNTEATTGSDPAMVALAKAATPTAAALLGQAVIGFSETAAGLNDSTAAPITGAGSVLSAIGNAAATGTASIAFQNSTAAAPTVSGSSTGIFIVTATQATVPTGYRDVIDAAAAPATITGAAGSNELILGGASGLSFFAAAGASGTIALTGGTNLVVGPTSGGGNWNITGENGSRNTIFAGSGNDTIAAGSGSNIIGLGSGSNLVLSSGNDTISGATGRDTVIAQGGTQNIVAGTQGLTFVGGSGTASISASGSGATIFGGTGANVALFGSAPANLLVAGAGNETLQGAGATGSEDLFGGSGNATLTGGSGTNSFWAGTGNDVMVGGRGSNLFQFVNGHAGGVNVVDGFTSTDKISLSGYGGNAVQQAISSAQTTGGSTLITLPDQTRIFLTDVSSVNTSNFA